MLQTGEKAPDFTAESTQGRITLSEIEDTVVLFFFPKVKSPVCKRETCSFEDNLPKFEKKETKIIGVSHTDSLDELKNFSEKNNIEYPLISNSDGEISEVYEAKGLLGGKRITYIIKNGKIVKSIKGLLRAKKHVKESLDAVS